MQPTTPRRKRAASPVLSTPTSASSSEWFLPDFAQAHKLGFSLEKNGSAGVLDFVHKDKTTLSYVCLHSEHQPGRFALIDNYKLVFCGTVASEADFTALLLKHNWQDPKTPVAKAAKKEKEGPKEEKPRREPPHPTEWRSGALALLATMTPEGQQRTLVSWAQISKEAGGPFAPALLDAPVPALPEEPASLLEAALGLLDDFTIIDLEFQAKPQALLELAAIRYKNWQPVGKVVSFVQCRQELNPYVAKLTGINRSDVYNAPPEIEVLRKFFKLAEGSLLIAHNIAADKKQLEDARKRCGATSDLPNPWFCTLALARARRSKDAACGLGELCLDFGINAVGAHRALRDVEMTFQVLRYFHAQQPITELITSSAKPKAKQASLFPLAA
jgi:DNA polymerase III epsilon subunit-like protein